MFVSAHQGYASQTTDIWPDQWATHSMGEYIWPQAKKLFFPTNTKSLPNTSILYESLDLAEFIKKLRPKPPIPHAEAMSISFSILYYGRNRYNLPEIFVLTIIMKESMFYPKVVGSDTDTGLMQVVPRYHRKRMKRLGNTRNDLKRIIPNIETGCDILYEARGGHKDIYSPKVLKRQAHRYNGSLAYARDALRKYKELMKKYTKYQSRLM